MKRLINATVCWLLLISLSGCGGNPSNVAVTQEFSADYVALYNKAKKSIFTVYIDEGGILNKLGSAFVVNGVVITARHVGAVADELNGVLWVENETGVRYKVKKISLCEETDLAKLTLDTNDKLPTLKLASRNPAIGSDVVAIGCPLDTDRYITGGLLSGYADFASESGSFNTEMFTASIAPGSSGGALLNSKGEVIGVTIAGRVDWAGFYYAVPCEDMAKFINKKTT